MFIDPDCNLENAARRLLWGKCANAGQTCVAPDYILVPRSFQDTLIDAFKKEYYSILHSPPPSHLFPRYQKFYPESVATPGTYARLVSPQAFTRVNGLLKATKGTIVLGGETDEATKFIAPTIVKDVGFDDSLMSEYVFALVYIRRLCTQLSAPRPERFSALFWPSSLSTTLIKESHMSMPSSSYM